MTETLIHAFLPSPLDGGHGVPLGGPHRALGGLQCTTLLRGSTPPPSTSTSSQSSPVAPPPPPPPPPPPQPLLPLAESPFLSPQTALIKPEDSGVHGTRLYCDGVCLTPEGAMERVWRQAHTLLSSGDFWSGGGGTLGMTS